MSDATAATIAAADINPSRTTATVYGVRLFSDNSQNARENARAAAAIFTELQPGIPVEVTYQIPHFFVTAGLFIDRTEAVALSGRVLTQFKSAMVVQREVPLLEVIAAERIELTEPEEKDAQEAGGAGIIGSGGGGNTTVDSLRVTEKPRVF
jgi:hypothetical protein